MKKLNNFTRPFSLNIKLNVAQMLVSNVHLGHTKKFSSVKIKPFLLGYRNNIYILNVSYTLNQIKLISALIINIISLRQKLLIIKDRDFFNFKMMLRLPNVFFFDKKWTGGVLTNFRKVRNSKKFKEEQTSFNSLRAMRYLPSCVFFFDADLSYWALMEASNLDIPISAVVDSNINRIGLINYPIVGNNKSFEALYLYLNLIKNAAIKGRQKELLKILRIV